MQSQRAAHHGSRIRDGLEQSRCVQRAAVLRADIDVIYCRSCVKVIKYTHLPTILYVWSQRTHRDKGCRVMDLKCGWILRHQRQQVLVARCCRLQIENQPRHLTIHTYNLNPSEQNTTHTTHSTTDWWRANHPVKWRPLIIVSDPRGQDQRQPPAPSSSSPCQDSSLRHQQVGLTGCPSSHQRGRRPLGLAATGGGVAGRPPFWRQANPHHHHRRTRIALHTTTARTTTPAAPNTSRLRVFSGCQRALDADRRCGRGHRFCGHRFGRPDGLCCFWFICWLGGERECFKIAVHASAQHAACKQGGYLLADKQPPNLSLPFVDLNAPPADAAPGRQGHPHVGLQPQLALGTRRLL